MFEKELAKIENSEILSFTEIVLKNAPDSFFNYPASSTGKYHPVTSLGSGGLIVHTKEVFWIANTILDTQLDIFNNCNKDIVLSSCLLHDIYKYGDNNYHMMKNHGSSAVWWIECLPDVEQFFSVYDKYHLPKWYLHILNCIHAHHGRFSTEWGDTYTIEMAIVHISDYLASRKFLLFDEQNI